MTDGIQKGSGNAYALQTVANAASLYPTYEQFIQAFATGQLFADLKLNSEGWDPLGTSLNKTSLLKDATAALYGKSAAAVPDDIFAAIRPLITAAHNVVKFQSGTFTGTGNNSEISIGFRPKLLLASQTKKSSDSSRTDYNYYLGINGYLFGISGNSGYSPSWYYNSGTITENGFVLTTEPGKLHVYAAVG